jgi:predicted DNA-binding transcriptional regulator AlpA
MVFKQKIDLTQITEPTWLKEVAPNSCMNLKDLAQIFQVKESTMYQKVTNGEFPQPDVKHMVGRSFGKAVTFSNKNQWRISTIRQFFKSKGITNENTNGKESTTNPSHSE